MRHLKSFRVFENQTLSEDEIVQKHLNQTAANLAKEAGVDKSSIIASTGAEPKIEPMDSEALGEAALKKLKLMFVNKPDRFKKLISELGVEIPANLREELGITESYRYRVYEANYGTVETEMSEADAKKAASEAISRHGLKAFLFGFTGLLTALTGASGYLVSEEGSTYSDVNRGETNWDDYPAMKTILITAGVGLMIAAVVNAYKASTKQSAFNKKFGSK